MPRTTTLDCAGCPPLRAITFDALGLIKVIEARGKEGGFPKVVEKWGEPDSSKCVLAASIDDSKSNPLLAVARKNGMIEILNPLNGDVCFSIPNDNGNVGRSENDAIIGLHLLARKKMEFVSRSCTLLTCTEKGKASIRSFEETTSSKEFASTGSSRTWEVCNAGSILCSKLDGSENYALFGGKGVEVNVWDLDTCTKTWTAKSPPKNSLGIFTPTCFTSATFLSKDDHRKFVAGTYSHQVRLYDISAQRRPVISFDFRETPIKALAEDLDGYTIYVGNGSGDLSAFDMRTGKLLGSFLGKCSGSIRSIVRHPELPVLASCGLDSYLRFWDVKTRQLLSAVFLKQHLVNVLIDSNFADEEVSYCTEDLPSEAQNANETQIRDEETLRIKRKKASKEHRRNKKESKQNNGSEDLPSEAQNANETQIGDEETLPIKRKKASKEHRRNKKESKQNNGSEDLPSEAQNANETQIGDEETLPIKRKKASKEHRRNKKESKQNNGSETSKENGGRKSKSKKSSKRSKHEVVDDES